MVTVDVLCAMCFEQNIILYEQYHMRIVCYIHQIMPFVLFFYVPGIVNDNYSRNVKMLDQDCRFVPVKSRNVFKAFRCHNCGKSYRQKGNLQRHHNYECGLEPRFECAVCTKKFRYKFHLEVHIKYVHKVEPASIIDPY